MPAAPADIASLLGKCSFPVAGTPLVCAVSGGTDSLALLVLAVEAGCEATAVHVDHGLRPGSAAEADVVAAAAARLGAGFRAVTVEVAAGPDLEGRARAARRDALPAGHATGHTADDRAETIVLNLLRGAGPDGLAVLRPGPAHPIAGLRRRDTEAVCAAAGLDPVHDPSNTDPAFRRNRVRHEVVPLLADVAGRDVVPLLCRLGELAAADGELLATLAAAAVPDPTDAGAVAAAEGPLAARALRSWLRSPAVAGDAEHHPVDLATVTRVLAVARGEAVAAELPGGTRVARTAGRLRVERPVR
ncbi:MAG: tRNA lysidine(34) synthetase TilS [Acidimicrobiales bacterium]